MARSLCRTASAIVVVLMAAACGGGSGPSATAAGPSGVTAALAEFSITLGKTTVPSGAVEFMIKNHGSITHEFVVLDTDTPAADLPVEGAAVTEDALDVVDEREDIAANSATTLSANLDPGHYAIICNVDGHYQGGMHADFTVQ